MGSGRWHANQGKRFGGWDTSGEGQHQGIRILCEASRSHHASVYQTRIPRAQALGGRTRRQQ